MRISLTRWSCVDEFYLQTVSVNVELSHGFAPDVDVLDLLGGDVLALRQLEDVLLPVNNLQRAILQQTNSYMRKGEQEKSKHLNQVRLRRSKVPERTGSHLPMSPVWSQPSASRVSAVLSGSLR